MALAQIFASQKFLYDGYVMCHNTVKKKGDV